MATAATVDLLINTFNSETKLSGMTKTLREMKTALGNVDGKEFNKLANAINEAEGKIGDLNDSFNTLRGSGVERTNTSLNLMKEGLLNLDFDKVKIGANGLTAALGAGGLLGILGSVVLSFVDLNKVGEVAKKTFIQFTDAIGLTNNKLIQYYQNAATNSLKRASDLQTEIDSFRLLSTYYSEYNQNYLDAIKNRKNELENAKRSLEIVNSITNSKKESYALGNNQLGLLVENLFGTNVEQNKKTIEENTKLIQQLTQQLKELELQSTNAFNATVRDIELKTKIVFAKDAFEKNIILINDNYEKQKKKLTDDFNRIDKANRKEGTESYKEYIESLNKLDIIRTQDIKKQIEERKKYYEDLYGTVVKLEGKDFNSIYNAEIAKKPKKTIEPTLQGVSNVSNVQTGLSMGLTYQKSLQAQYQEFYKKNIDDYTFYTNSIKTLTNDLNNFLNQQDNRRLQDLQYNTQLQINLSNERYNSDLENSNSYYNALLSNENLSNEQRLKLQAEMQYQQQLIEYNRLVEERKLRKEALEENNKISEQQFKRNKALQIANTTINTASSVMKAAAEENYAAAIAMGVLGAAQTAIIARTKFYPQKDASLDTPIQAPQKPNVNTSVGSGGGNSNNANYYSLNSQNYGNRDDGGIVENKIYVSVDEINRVNNRVIARENRTKIG